ncbi:hypothetical protein AB0C13_23340 [Streptomyces sp. NPDC049099]|uniref:hypothetical protein n=1 Tax=Streptomyces sp. NPDC049099 TaxID=3155768 RepID=UPI00344362DF
MTWTKFAPYFGVMLGGFVSSLAQYWLGRASERAEVRRSIRERAEERRKERVTHVIAFLAAAQEAERVAVDRHHHLLSDEQWQARAKQVVDKMWVTQKTIHMLCGSEINKAAHGLATKVQDVIRKGPEDPTEPQDEKVWAYIRPSRNVFLDVVSHHLNLTEASARPGLLSRLRRQP